MTLQGITGKCEKHSILLVPQDAGSGKWIPVCPQCERERMDKLVEGYPVKGFYEAFK